MKRSIFISAGTAACLFMGSVTWGQEPVERYTAGNSLYDEKRYDAALTEYQRGLEVAEDSGNDYFAFFLARGIAECQSRLGNVTEYLQAAETALGCLERLEASGSNRMSRQTRTFERTLLLGRVAKHHLFAHQLALARQWHDRAGAELVELVQLYEGDDDYDLLSGELPRRMPRQFRVEIPRHLWMGSWLLEKEARTDEALAHLDAAGRFFDNIGSDLNVLESDYQRKVANRKALLLDFLGYLDEAIAMQQQMAAEPLTGVHARSVLIERLNLYRNLSQYHGPSEEYLDKTIAAYEEIKKRSPGGEDLRVRKQINKMIFDLREDASVVADFEAIEAGLIAKGYISEADYTEREQIRVAIRLGETEGLELRLIELLEKFRDQGNRVGVPFLYREYGDLLMSSGRAGEAVYLFRQALNLSTAYGWDLHLPLLMAKLAQAHLALGDTVAAEEWVRAIERHLATHSDAPAHRIALAKAELVDLLRDLGHTQEADSLKSWTIAYANANGVPDYQVRNLIDENVDGTALAQAAGRGDGGDEEEEPEKSDADEEHGIDFQPIRVHSEVVAGETAYARFTLANLSAQTLSGNLQFPPGIVLASWGEQQGDLRLATGGDQADSEKSPATGFSLEIGAAELIRVFVESEVVMGEEDREFAFEWTREGVESRRSEWTFAATDSASELTVVNGNMIELNPFYSVPLYHAVRARSSEETLRDFRVVCSVPCYVELIDDATATVLAIDRRGDGDFNDQGDIVVADENGNLFPDVRFSADAPVFGMELQVYPTHLDTLEGVEEFTVSIEALVQGSWEVLAENRVQTGTGAAASASR